MKSVTCLVRFWFLIMLGHLLLLKQVLKLETAIGQTAINNIDRQTYKHYVSVAQEDCSSDFPTPENERKV